MSNELCGNKFSVPTFEEILRMNDRFSSFLCPYCGKWHRLEECSDLPSFMKDYYPLSKAHGFTSYTVTACLNPFLYSLGMSYEIVFSNYSFKFEIKPYSKLETFDDSLHESCCSPKGVKNFSGEIPYSSFYLHPKWTPDLPEIKYLCDINISSLEDVCGATDFKSCNHCYLYDCLKENRPIRLGFGFKYNPELATSSLKYIVYKYIRKMPEVFLDKSTGKPNYLSLFSRDDNGRFLIDEKNFKEWLFSRNGGSIHWPHCFMDDLLTTLLKDDKDKIANLKDLDDLEDFIDSKL